MMPNIPNLHRTVYYILGGILAVCLTIQSGALVLPPSLQGAQFYAVVLVIFLGFFLPHFGAETPPGQPTTSLPARPVIAGGAERPRTVYVWPLPTGFGKIGGLIVVVVALLVLLGIRVPNAEWWCVFGFGLWLAF